MEIPEITKELFAAKKRKGLSFSDLEGVVHRNEVWIAALFYRQACASQEEAEKLAFVLGLGSEIAAALTEIPTKGLGPVVPVDPFVYRFYEIMQIYGMPLKEVIQEKLGDGIMSAVDFTLDVDKKRIPKVIAYGLSCLENSCPIKSGKGASRKSGSGEKDLFLRILSKRYRQRPGASHRTGWAGVWWRK